MDIPFLVIPFLILLGIIPDCSAYTCRKYYSTYFPTSTYYYIYCLHGCCGSTYNKYCCSSGIYFGSGGIAGAVIGGIVTLAVIIILWIVCLKYKIRKGRVIHNSRTAQVTTVTSSSVQPTISFNSTAQPGPPPPYSSYPAGQPPPYSAATTSSTYPPPPPPQYTPATDPAYPPSTPNPFTPYAGKM